MARHSSGDSTLYVSLASGATPPQRRRLSEPTATRTNSPLLSRPSDSRLLRPKLSGSAENRCKLRPPSSQQRRTDESSTQTKQPSSRQQSRSVVERQFELEHATAKGHKACTHCRRGGNGATAFYQLTPHSIAPLLSRRTPTFRSPTLFT